MEIISDIPNAPKAIGAYSPAVKANGFLFISGQVPIDPSTGSKVSGGIKEETSQVLSNLETILSHANCSFFDVVETTIFLTDLSNFQIVNEIYANKIGDARPARVTVGVSQLPLGSLVEIKMIAVCK